MTDERRVVTGGPDSYATGDEFVTDLQTFLRKIGRVNPRAHFYAKIYKLFPIAYLQIVRKRGNHPRFGFDKNHTLSRLIVVPDNVRQRESRNTDIAAQPCDS